MTGATASASCPDVAHTSGRLADAVTACWALCTVQSDVPRCEFEINISSASMPPAFIPPSMLK